VRLAVLADVHGNMPALEAVLVDVQQQGVQGIIVAGDLTCGGPHSAEVLRLLHALSSWMVRGNNEDYLLAYDAGRVPDGWKVGKQWSLLRWAYAHLDREELGLIASLPEQRVVALPGTAPIRVVHGSLGSSSEHLFPGRDPAVLRVFEQAGLLRPGHDTANLDLALEQTAQQVLVCGHAHIPWKQEQDGRLAFNPGAVCGPLNGDVRAQYALLCWQDEHWQVEHRAIPYDLDLIRTAFCQSGLLAEGDGLARAFLVSIETGRNVGGDLVSHARRLAVEAGHEGCDVVPDDVWEQAVATFDWEGAANGGGC